MNPESFDEQLSRFDLMCEGDPTFDLSDNDIAALLAVRTEMRIMARSTLASQERIDELEAKLAALDWTEITESNLPKVGDEVWGRSEVTLVTEERLFLCQDCQDWVRNGYTHKRPTNPPPPSGAKGETKP